MFRTHRVVNGVRSNCEHPKLPVGSGAEAVDGGSSEGEMPTAHGCSNSRSSEGRRSDGTLQRMGSKLFESDALFRHHLGLL